MNTAITTAKLLPLLAVLPLGAAAAASFMQRDPARIKVRSNGEDDRKRRGRS